MERLLFPLLYLLSGILAHAASADEDYTQVFRFDQPDAPRQWIVGQSPLGRDGVKLSDQYVTFSRHSLELLAPAWKPGNQEWPLWRFRGTDFPADWTPYDRLLIDFVNPTTFTELIGIKSVDRETAKHSTGNWRGIKVNVLPRSHLRAVVPLEQLMRGILVRKMDQSDIRAFMLYATRPEGDFRLYVSNITLLKPGQELPPLPREYVEQVLDLRLRPALKESREAMDRLPAQLQGLPHSIQTWAMSKLRTMHSEWESLDQQVSVPQFSLDQVAEVVEQLEQMTREAKRIPSLIRLCRESMERGEKYVVAWASSMEKVIPREMPLDNLEVRQDGEIQVARNESESIQIAVLPIGNTLQDVRIEIGEFQDSEGHVLPEGTLDVRVVGYVHTRPVPYEVDFTGWWPDPLLDFLNDGVEIADEDAQTFWIRVRPGLEQPAGVYQGTLRVLADNQEPVERTLSIRVRDFELPSTPPIPVAIPNGREHYFSQFSEESWDTLKFKVADFQADYYVSWDNLYATDHLDWEILEHLKAQGRLGMFNLYPLGNGVGRGRTALKSIVDGDPEETREALDKLVARIEPYYQEAKERGLLEHAYFYGMDEAPHDMLYAVKVISDHIKQAFPDIPIATTAFDFTLGERSQADNIDIWVPIIHEYQNEVADAARERGKTVWWYNCKTPAHPYPNQFTEYPAIEQRLMHGAMSAKYEVEGFLYYSFFRAWRLQGTPERQAIDSGPYTEWDPCALAFSEYDLYNGEGYMAYPGPNGRPLASVRLENFRDGFEDLAWWQILQGQVETLLVREKDLTSTEQRWLKEAQEALQVPEDLVKSAHEFTLDSDKVLQWRNRIGDAIEQFAQITPNNQK